MVELHHARRHLPKGNAEYINHEKKRKRMREREREKKKEREIEREREYTNDLIN